MENIVVLKVMLKSLKMKAFMTVMRYATCYTSRILRCGALRSRAF